MLKIVADNKIPFLQRVFEKFNCQVVYLPGNKISHADLIDADALITRTRTICNEELLHDTKVKIIVTATIGTDHIDQEYLNKANIEFFSAPGCNSSSVNQYIVSTLINLAENEKISLKGKTLGIIGVGNVGSKVAKSAEILGMNVILNDPPRAEQEGNADGKFAELDYLLANSDFITIHTPLNESTYHLADLSFFEKCTKRFVYFINSSRGSVCNNNDLLYALKNGLIRGAVLDVWENEPEINSELLLMLDYATPHIAGYSANGKANGTTVAVRRIAEFFEIDGLKNFELPPFKLTPNSRINLQNEKNILFKAINESYDIKKDSLNLKKNPEKFEFLRNEYHYRLEFPFFSVYNIEEADKNDLITLKNMGFKIENV